MTRAAGCAKWGQTHGAAEISAGRGRGLGGRVLVGTADGREPRSPAGDGRFQLKYAPHFGMFKHSAGDDLIDQLKFAADQGFTAWEDDGLQDQAGRRPRAIARTINSLGMEMGAFVATAGIPGSELRAERRAGVGARSAGSPRQRRSRQTSECQMDDGRARPLRGRIGAGRSGSELRRVAQAVLRDPGAARFGPGLGTAEPIGPTGPPADARKAAGRELDLPGRRQSVVQGCCLTFTTSTHRG